MLSERLKLVLEHKNISQVQLANKLKLTPPAINRWCNGVTEPDNNTIVEIAQILNVSTDFLLGNDEKLSVYEEELKEIEILKKLLVKVGYMRPDEDLSKKELDNLIKMAKNNKDFLKENK